MARKATYDKRGLSVACSKVKTQIVKKVKSGELKVELVTKTFAFNELSKKLNLTSTSSFWKPSYQFKDYLDSWYSKLDDHLKEIAPKKQPDIKADDVIDVGVSSSSSGNLTKELREKNAIIDSLLTAINTLRIENESLRLAKLSRLGYIDNVEILNEDIDDIELEKLYKAITTLYNSRRSNSE